MRPSRYNTRPTMGGLGRRPLGGCCCTENCTEIFSGSTITLDQPIYQTEMPPEREGDNPREGRVTEMCVHALVCDWVHIWNPIQWYSLFQVGGAESGEVCFTDPPSPTHKPAPGELEPDWFPDPIPLDRTPKGLRKGCTTEPASFPITSHDEDDPPNPPNFPACWDLRCVSFAGDTMTHGEPNNPQYGCGFLETEDCRGAYKRYGNIAFDGFTIIRGGMAIAWRDDSETIFGKIIRDGDRIGWFENPHRVRHVILTQHFRIRMRRLTKGAVPHVLAPPPWDYYVSPSGKNYYSIGQNINFIGLARIEPKGINAIVP